MELWEWLLWKLPWERTFNHTNRNPRTNLTFLHHFGKFRAPIST